MISGVIITYNEEKQIQKCIESMMGIVDEVVVLDSFSTDKTAEICKQLGAKFYQQAFAGFGPQKRKAVELASYDHILSLDADEILTDELKNIILEEKKKGLADAYSFKRRNIFCGSFIKHCGWYPDRKVRLFNRQKMNWNTNIVHEVVDVPQGINIVALDADMVHHTFDSYEQHLESSLKFAKLSVEQRKAKGKTSNWLVAACIYIYRFFMTYFWKFGFLDGKNGYLIAKVSAIYTFHKYWWREK